MNYKPDESTLIDYLYEELSQQEREQVHQYLEQNPGVKKELEELKEVRTIMGKLPDNEVAEPTFIFDRNEVVVVKRNILESSFFKTMASIAASIVLVILTGYFTNAHISYSDSTLNIGFGVIEPVSTPSEITKEEVRSWMQQTMAENNTDILDKIDDVEDHLSKKFNQHKSDQDNVIKTALKQSQQVSDVVIQKYVSQMQAENKGAIENLFLLTSNQQQQYMDAVLSDFSLYLEEQRQNDLDRIQMSFNGLKDNTEISQLETNQILASIITTVNNQNN